jgi:hypothetical protein
MCLAKGALVGAAGAVAIGIVSVGVVALCAPVAAVTLGLGALAVIGGGFTAGDIGLAIRASNWDRLAYDLGGIAGRAAAGGIAGGKISWGINGYRSQRYDSSLGSRWTWFGTGPHSASAAFTAGAGGAGAAAAVGSEICGCH